MRALLVTVPPLAGLGTAAVSAVWFTVAHPVLADWILRIAARAPWIAFVLVAAAPGLLNGTSPAAPLAAPLDDLQTLISRLTTFLVSVALGIGTLFATIGALRWITADGDPAAIERAKGSFKNAAIGYAAALLSPLLLGLVQQIIGGN